MGGGGPYTSAGTGGPRVPCRVCVRRGDACDRSCRRRGGLRRRGEACALPRRDRCGLRRSVGGIGGGGGALRTCAARLS